MANYLTKNESFHIFSKSPVLSDMAVSQAVNKSGHTVSVSDLWSDDIPWFTEVANKEEAIKRAVDAKYNDIILISSNIYKRKGDKTNGASSGTTFENLWEEYTELKEARNFALSSVTNSTPSNIAPKTIEIKNSSDRVVIKYHVGKPIELLTVNNNANVPSTWAARMFINDKVVDQFVSPTDKVFAGNPSTGYTTLVYTATTNSNKYTFVSEGETDGDFVNNTYAGIIQFNQSRNSNHKFAASIFEYVGGKLNTTDTIVDGSDEVPTSNAVYDHVKSHENKNIHITSSERTSWNNHINNDDIHVTLNDKNTWNNNITITTNHINNDDIHITDDEKTSWNNKISEIVNGNFINVTNKNTISVKTSTTISDDATTVPTTKAVHQDTNITKYYFPDLDYEDRKDYMILDYTGSPTYVSFADEIVDGYSMFRGWGMNKFIVNFPNLTSGEEMFRNCPYLYYVDSDFSKVTNGYRMFSRATVQFGGSAGGDYVHIPIENQPIMYFKSSLRSLTDGSRMFEGCKLGKQAVLNIVNTLKTENECNTDANITLGIVKTLENDQEILTALGITAGATSAQITNKVGKKWNVTIQWINLT